MMCVDGPWWPVEHRVVQGNVVCMEGLKDGDVGDEVMLFGVFGGLDVDQTDRRHWQTRDP